MMYGESDEVTVGVVQAASPFLRRDEAVTMACHYIAEAGGKGIKLLGFPEGFIPAHPLWYHYFPASSRHSMAFAQRLFDNSVEIPGPEVERLCHAAHDAGVNVVIGVCERRPQTSGTLFNTQLFISEHGTVLGKHRKITPTLGERLVHTGGYGDGLQAFSTSAGRVSGLICGENSNPLASFALAAQGAQIHVASWPNHFAQGEHRPKELVSTVSRGLAYSMGAFVLSACGTISDEMADELQFIDADATFLADRTKGGGSVIVGPDSTVLAGPMEGTEQGILAAEIDLKQCVIAKHIHDYAGHYNRADIFTLMVNRSNPEFVEYARSTRANERTQDNPSRAEVPTDAEHTAAEAAQ